MCGCVCPPQLEESTRGYIETIMKSTSSSTPSNNNLKIYKVKKRKRRGNDESDISKPLINAWTLELDLIRIVDIQLRKLD